ncbi:hypothetical protein QUB68_20585, partial [Microcoleus sp. A006_D1]|uniref:hypothetical protein n=1 Tax=Microcoleus sp. A006_D1 TaxID=3055267 RepID=UPI002FD6955A
FAITILGVYYARGQETGFFTTIVVKNHKSRKKPGFLVRSVKAKETSFAITILGVYYARGQETGFFTTIVVKNHKSRKKPGFLVRSIKAKETGFFIVLGCCRPVFGKNPVSDD